MLDWMFALILIIAILLFLIVFFFEKDLAPQWLFAFVILDIVIWYSLAFSNFYIETPYELFNGSSGQIETGFHYVSSQSSPALFYIFLGFGTIMFIYMSYYLFMTLLAYIKKMKGF